MARNSIRNRKQLNIELTSERENLLNFAEKISGIGTRSKLIDAALKSIIKIKELENKKKEELESFKL